MPLSNSNLTLISNREKVEVDYFKSNECDLLKVLKEEGDFDLLRFIEREFGLK